MVDTIMGHLPLLGEDHAVLQDHVLNLIGGRQHLLVVLLGICLNPINLGSMSSPLMFSIVDLEEIGLGLSKSPISISLTRDSNFNILGRKQRAIVVPCQIT